MAKEPVEAEEDNRVAPVSVSAPEQMRRAREAAGLSLEEVAARTRVPLRHLAALEAGQYDRLPGTTYCAGFARAFARSVGIDETELVAKVRSEIDDMGGLATNQYEFEEAVDPSSIPPRLLAWIAAALVILLAGGYAIWRMQLNTPPTDEQLAAEQRPETRIAEPVAGRSGAAPVTPASNGPVVMTAVNEVWLRIYEAGGKRLFEGTLSKDQSYTVPQDAKDPLILTGRPDALSVTVGGRAIPPLGPPERTISDVPISAAALLARKAAPAEGDETPPPASNAATR